MDGSKNATTENEPVTDKQAKKISKRRSQPQLEHETKSDGSPLPKTCLLQKNCKDRANQATSVSIMGVPKAPSTTADLRSRSGGRSVEVRSPNSESSRSEVHPREPSPTTSKDNQPNSMTVARAISKQISTTTASDDPSGSEQEPPSNHQFMADEDASIWSNVLPGRPPSLPMENICRICHETDQMEPLISPCLCRGSLSLVHRTCLQHWLAESDTSSCELCRFLYVTKRVPKYSLFGSVVAWIRQNRRQRKALMVDTLGLIAFVPFATMITYVAAALAEGIEYQETQPSWTDVTVRFAIVTFISLMTTIDVAYATYWMLRAQHHFTTWYSWYRRNSDVTLLPRSNSPS